MEQRLVFKNQEKCIYFMKENHLDFYLVIPNCKKVSLILGLVEQVTDQKIQEFSLPSEKALVVPMVTDQILLGVKEEQVSYFDYLDKVFSNILNLAHKILVFNHIEVENVVYFYQEASYDNFQRWFLQKYVGRVQAISFHSRTVAADSVPVSQEVPSSIHPDVGAVLSDEAVDPSNQIQEEVVEHEGRTKEPGFVSYVLLGVLVAVLSLVFLYFII